MGLVLSLSAAAKAGVLRLNDLSFPYRAGRRIPKVKRCTSAYLALL